MCCSYSISQVEDRSYLQKLVSKAKGSAPIILWTSLDDNNKKGQTPLFGNNLWMEWIQERHFAKAAKSSNITGSVPSSVQQLHSQRLLRNKDKWSLSAPEVLIFSFPFSLFPMKCEEMLSLCSISAGCFSFHMEIYRCKDIPYASSPAVSEAVNFENIGVEVGVDPFSVIKK